MKISHGIKKSAKQLVNFLKKTVVMYLKCLHMMIIHKNL
jgi:hypothetical protein